MEHRKYNKVGPLSLIMKKESKEEKSSKNSDKSGGQNRKVRVIVLNLIRLLLVVAFFGALFNGRNLILFISIFAFVATFLPMIFKKVFDVELPAQLEVIVILFIYGALFFGKVNGFYAEFWWWSILLNVTLASAFGLVGLTVMYSLYKGDKIHGSPLIIAVFAFCFAVAVGTVWEFF